MRNGLGWAMRPIIGWALLVMMCALRAAGANAATLDETARVIAGLDGAYTQEVSAYWKEYERKIGRPMRQWGCQEIGRIEGGTVFYPFAGPDLPAVYQLFPDADRYVLLSMQKGEPPPRIDAHSKAELAEYLASFRRAWKFYDVLGFFRTDDLDGQGKAEGRRPIGITSALMAFAVRLGFQVEAVEPMQLDLNRSELVPREAFPERRDTWDSVRLTLRKDGRKVIVDHVRLDLSNAVLGRDPGPRKWLESVASNPTLLKAASHHPQEPEFSILKNIVLAGAPMIVQDETGIEYGALADAFAVRLYGKFTRPNASFSSSMQQSLAAAYRKSGAVKPLPFRAGYEKDGGSSYQIATRNPATAQAPRKCAAPASG